MTTKIAIVDVHTGFVWGESRTIQPDETREAACLRAADEIVRDITPGADGHSEYKRVDPHEGRGFRCYLTDHNTYDGQDDDEIAAVEAGECIGWVD